MKDYSITGGIELTPDQARRLEQDILLLVEHYGVGWIKLVEVKE